MKPGFTCGNTGNIFIQKASESLLLRWGNRSLVATWPLTPDSPATLNAATMISISNSMYSRFVPYSIFLGVALVFLAESEGDVERMLPNYIDTPAEFWDEAERHCVNMI